MDMTITELSKIGFKFGSLGGGLTLKQGDYYNNGAAISYHHKNDIEIYSKEDVDIDGFSLCINSSSSMISTTIKLKNINTVEDIIKLKSLF